MSRKPGRGPQSLRPVSVATGSQLQPQDVSGDIRRCQRCGSPLPVQGRGRPRQYCDTCRKQLKLERDAAYHAARRPNPPSLASLAEYAERLRQSHADALRRANALREGDAGKDPRRALTLRPRASVASTYNGGPDRC